MNYPIFALRNHGAKSGNIKKQLKSMQQKKKVVKEALERYIRQLRNKKYYNIFPGFILFLLLVIFLNFKICCNFFSHSKAILNFVLIL